MRSIAIVGAGQAGLMAALTLQRAGYDITVYSARTPEEIRTGNVLSTQCMFDPSLELERQAGLNFWDGQAPWIQGQRVLVAGPSGQMMLSFYGPWHAPAQSVDQRVKMAHWLQLFADNGGRVITHAVYTSDLDKLASRYELTIIAAGRGELIDLFDRDEQRSPYTTLQRRLSVIYLHGVQPWPSQPVPQVRINACPEAGEFFIMPALTTSGPCDAALIEAVPGGPLDRWNDARTITPQAHLHRLRTVLKQFFPWEEQLLSAAVPTDPHCTLAGGYTPTVRHPVAHIGGRPILAMGDVGVLNDPICGQGSNAAAHAAAIYCDAIIDHGDNPFTAEWMQATFEEFWSYAQWPTALSNAFLGDLPPHVLAVLQAAAADPAVASRFAEAYARPHTVPWLLDSDQATAYLNELGHPTAPTASSVGTGDTA